MTGGGFFHGTRLGPYSALAVKSVDWGQLLIFKGKLVLISLQMHLVQ